MAAVLWGVWFARNQQIFQAKTMMPTIAVNWSMKQIVEWSIVHKKRSQAIQSLRRDVQYHEGKWLPPEHGNFKVNVDASVVEGAGSFSVGMVLRDHLGQYVKGKTMRFVGNVPVQEAEMVGILEAIVWTGELPAYVNASIESDSLLSVNAVNGRGCNYLEIGDLVRHCKTLLCNRSGVSLSYVRKRANKVAHIQAKIPCELNSFIIFPSPPILLLETLLSDVSI